MAYVKDYFDIISKEYEKQSRYKYYFYKWFIDNTIKQINRSKGHIIDLGTGNGELALRIAARFPRAKVTGIDISSGMIQQAKKKSHIFNSSY